MLNKNNKDDFITVNTHVTKDDDITVKDFEYKYHRKLNCIKITANSPNAKFIQFCTRQTPDIFTYIKSSKTIMKWAEIEPHYMTDIHNPKWKLDVPENEDDSFLDNETDNSEDDDTDEYASSPETTIRAKNLPLFSNHTKPKKKIETCFYEDNGLSKKNEDSISMYDDPSGMEMVDEERAVFCTFVFLDGKITHLIKWSKEIRLNSHSNEDEGFVDYSFYIEKWNKDLPLWAIKILKEFYKKNNADVPFELCSQDIIEKAENTEDETIKEEAKQFFFRYPDNWITLKNYPDFFNEKNENTEEKISSYTSLKQ